MLFCWSVHSELCFLAALFLPSTSTDVLFPESRVPSPDPAQLPRLRGPVSSDSPNLPAVPRASSLHGSQNPRDSPGIPTVCVASWSRRIPASRPPRLTHQHPVPPNCLLNRLRALLATLPGCLGRSCGALPAPGFLGIFRGVLPWFITESLINWLTRNRHKIKINVLTVWHTDRLEYLYTGILNTLTGSWDVRKD